MRTRNPAGFLGETCSLVINLSWRRASACSAARLLQQGRLEHPTSLPRTRRASLFLPLHFPGANNCAGSPGCSVLSCQQLPPNSIPTPSRIRELPRHGLERVAITKERGLQGNVIPVRPETAWL